MSQAQGADGEGGFFSVAIVEERRIEFFLRGSGQPERSRGSGLPGLCLCKAPFQLVKLLGYVELRSRQRPASSTLSILPPPHNG